MGTGSVYPIIDHRSGQKRWIAQVSIGGRDNRRLVKRVRPTERAARAVLKELREQVKPRGTSRLSLRLYLEGWVADVRDLAPRTRVEYLNAIDLHIVPAIGHIRLSALLPSHVEGMLRSLEPVLSPKSRRNVLGVLRRALTFAVRDELVSRNVAAREYIDPIHVEARAPRVLTPDERHALLQAAQGHWLEGLIVTADGTGLRLGELLGLTWQDVDLEAGRLDVRHALRRIKGETRKTGYYVRDKPKTERSARPVPLAPSIVAALHAHRARVTERFVPIATGPVFPSLRGDALSSGWVLHQFYDLCAAAKIKRASPKVLRATFASRLHDAGVPERRIQDLLGHKPESKVTQRHYIGAGEWSEAVAAVSEVVG